MNKIVFIIIFGIFLISFLIFSDDDFKSFNIKIKEAPLVTFEKIKAFSIKNNKIILTLDALKANKYDNKDELYNCVINFIQNKKEYEVKANKTTFKDKKIFFEKNVVLKQKNDFTLNTQKVVFDKNKKNISINTKFKLYRKNIVARGKQMDYNLNTKVIKIKNIEVVMKDVNERF